MKLQSRFIVVGTVVLSLLGGGRLWAQEDVADITSHDLRAGKDEKKRYFLVGPHQGVAAPKKGYGLLVVMPGGDGSADFHPFVDWSKKGLALALHL